MTMIAFCAKIIRSRNKKSGVARLLLRVDVPDDVVGETVYAVSRSFGHLCKTLGFGLVFEGVAWEIYACESSLVQGYSDQHFLGVTDQNDAHLPSP
jgi:hypothetical protein